MQNHKTPRRQYIGKKLDLGMAMIFYIQHKTHNL